MWTVKSNYDKHGQLVYTSSPYIPAELSDGDDDDLCVWDYSYDSDEGPFPDKKTHTSQTHKPRLPNPNKEAPSSHHKSKQSGPGKQLNGDRGATDSEGCLGVSSQPDENDAAKQAAEEALISAAQNLTMLSQYVLKLEVRTGKTTKEAIRQTLDNTAEQAAIDVRDHGLSQQELVRYVTRVSEETSRRMHLIDRHWRRQTSRKQGEQPSRVLQLLGEPDVKTWIKIETKDSHIASQDPCYFTVQNLAAGRKFRNWITYLRQLCGFKDTAEDDVKLVNIAWRFLDRDLRGDAPSPSTEVDAFICELEDKFNAGKFETALSDPKRQEKTDDGSWNLIRRLWSARKKPQ